MMRQMGDLTPPVGMLDNSVECKVCLGSDATIHWSQSRHYYFTFYTEVKV